MEIKQKNFYMAKNLMMKELDILAETLCGSVITKQSLRKLESILIWFGKENTICYVSFQAKCIFNVVIKSWILKKKVIFAIKNDNQMFKVDSYWMMWFWNSLDFIKWFFECIPIWVRHSWIDTATTRMDHFLAVEKKCKNFIL